MISTILCTVSIFCYLLSTFLLVKNSLKKQANHQATLSGWLGVIAHLAFITLQSLQTNNIDFSLFNVASLISGIIVLLLLLASLSKPVEKLGLFIFPIAALMLFLDISFPDNGQLLTRYDWKMKTHILSSIIAFSLLNIAALQAIFLAIQDQQLRKHPPRKIALSLPPLQTMESLLFQMIFTGIIFLTVSLLSGFIFIDDLFAQHLVHKTVLSILAWVIFSALLFGRMRFGWRGQTAIQWTLIGFTFLLLAYFGSKMVLELILDK